MAQAKQIWQESLLGEAAFWEGWLANNADKRVRFEANYPFPHYAIEALGDVIGRKAVIRALDLGSGPASTLGRYWPGHHVQITYVDPLADDYNSMLRRNGLNAFANIVKGAGETLLADVAARDFDYVYSGNALDHSYDPLLAIQNMIDIARPGGAIQFFTFENEGACEGYHGLHQWNFAMDGADAVLWNPGNPARPIAPLLKRITSFDAKTWFYEEMNRNAILVTMRKG